MPRFENHQEVDSYYSGNKAQKAAYSRYAAHRDLDRRKQQERDQERRRAESDRRRAVSDRRTAVSRAGTAVGAAPRVLSGVLGVMFCLLILVNLMGIVLNGNDMTNYFDGNTDGINRDGDFYLFGSENEKFAVQRTYPNGNVEFEHKADFVVGKYVSLSDTFDWVNEKIENLEQVNLDQAILDPIAVGNYLFWSIFSEEFGDFFINNPVRDALEDVWKGVSDWWSDLWGSKEDVEGG